MGKKIEVDDRFKKFGTVSFTAISKVNNFIDYLEHGSVRGTRCKDCGKAFFPPRSDCGHCLHNDMEWFEVRGHGKLVSYSRLEFAPAGFQDELPYYIAILDYGYFKIFGRIAKEVNENEIAIGQKMKTVRNELPNGQLNYVFKMLRAYNQ